MSQAGQANEFHNAEWCSMTKAVTPQHPESLKMPQDCDFLRSSEEEPCWPDFDTDSGTSDQDCQRSLPLKATFASALRARPGRTSGHPRLRTSADHSTEKHNVRTGAGLSELDFSATRLASCSIAAGRNSELEPASSSSRSKSKQHSHFWPCARLAYPNPLTHSHWLSILL